MSTHASIWTPRHTHRLWPRAKDKYTRPPVQPYVAPPPPPPLKRPPPAQEAPISAGELEQTALGMEHEAEELEQNVAAPSLKIQLGLLLRSEDEIKRVLKEWDKKGKGEFLKGEFRLNLKSTGLHATSAEADQLFDSWDDDKGGSLDLKELKRALQGVQDAARVWQNTPDPNRVKATALRKKAALARDAAEQTARAEQMEEDLARMKEELESDASVQLGALLFKRRIKPGAVVTNWAKSRGEHAGELSKAEFREQVIALGVQGATASDIDAVFDSFDEDGGGFMDADEAAQMIKELQVKSEKAEADKRKAEAAARAMRAKASKKAILATAPPAEVSPAPEPAQPSSPDTPVPRSPTTSSVKRKGGDGGSKTKAAGAASTAGPSPSSGAQSASPSDSASSKPKLDIAAEVGSAIGAATEAIVQLFSDRDKKKKKAADPEATEQLMAQAIHRMHNLYMARAFTAWQENAQERSYSLDLLGEATLKLKNPFLARAFNSWAAVNQGINEWRRNRKRAFAHLQKGRLIQGWMALSHIIKMEKTLGKVAKLAQNAAGMTETYMIKNSFDEWHKQQAQSELERHLENGFCCLLAYWIKTSCGRCAPRDIIITPDVAERLRRNGCCCL